MEDLNAPVFAQAKLEYTKQLKDILIQRIYDGMYEIYQKSKKENNSDDFDDNIVKIFRRNIEIIPKWNTDIIEEELQNIIKISKCDWLDDLITAVIISHTKILLSISSNRDNKKVNLTIPVVSNFIHKCYINFGREIWKNPYLYDENVISSEYQKNIKIIEGLISESIDITIRKLLPVKEILREHLESNELNKPSEEREILNRYDLEEQKLKNLKKSMMNELLEQKFSSNDTIDDEESVDNIKYFDDNIDETIIKKNTQGLEINNILDDNKDDFNYDNPDIIKNEDDKSITVEEKLNGYKKIIEENNNKIIEENNNKIIEVNDKNISIDNILDDFKKEININENIISTEPETNIEPEKIETHEPVRIEPVRIEPDRIESETNTLNLLTDKIEKNIKIIEKPIKTEIDNDDTMTVDNFMDDINGMLNNKEYNLFNDATEII
jgi:hypothetical protein